MGSSHSSLHDKIKIVEEVACWQSMPIMQLCMYAQVITSLVAISVKTNGDLCCMYYSCSKGAIDVAWNPLAFNNVTNALSNYCTCVIIIQAPVGFFINHWT